MPFLQKVANKSPLKELLITKWQLADSPVVPICQPKRCCQQMQMVARLLKSLSDHSIELNVHTLKYIVH